MAKKHTPGEGSNRTPRTSRRRPPERPPPPYGFPALLTTHVARVATPRLGGRFSFDHSECLIVTLPSVRPPRSCSRTRHPARLLRTQLELEPRASPISDGAARKPAACGALQSHLRDVHGQGLLAGAHALHICIYVREYLCIYTYLSIYLSSCIYLSI